MNRLFRLSLLSLLVAGSMTAAALAAEVPADLQVTAQEHVDAIAASHGQSDRVATVDQAQTLDDALSASVDPADSISTVGSAADTTPLDATPKSSLKRLAHSIVSRTTMIARFLTHAALRFIGVPFVFGGTSTSGFDCSGYVQHVYASAGIKLPRTADAQYYAASPINGAPVRGDLVFFQTYEPGPSHVGIYLGGGQFVHASSSHGVTVSRLADSYWRARYLGARRVIKHNS